MENGTAIGLTAEQERKVPRAAKPAAVVVKTGRDAETKALVSILKKLTALNDAERGRVLSYIAEKFIP